MFRKDQALARVGALGMFRAMSTITEIEAAIERLAEPQVRKLAAWLEEFRARCEPLPAVEGWLNRAVGAAKPGVTTADVMALMRGEG
jgi:hypothetical protein